jgi:hypothetical protein
MSNSKTIQVKQKSGLVKIVLQDYYCEAEVYIPWKKAMGLCGKLVLRAHLSDTSCIETVCPRCRSLQLIKKNV